MSRNCLVDPPYIAFLKIYSYIDSELSEFKMGINLNVRNFILEIQSKFDIHVPGIPYRKY